MLCAQIGVRTIAIIGDELVAYGGSLGPLFLFNLFETIHLEDAFVGDLNQG